MNYNCKNCGWVVWDGFLLPNKFSRKEIDDESE